MTMLLVRLWWWRWNRLSLEAGLEPNPVLSWLVRWWCPWLVPCLACGLLISRRGDRIQCLCGFALPLRDG
jgi:hypothetical protein